MYHPTDIYTSHRTVITGISLVMSGQVRVFNVHIQSKLL